MDNIIKSYLIDNYDNVVDVEFGTKYVHLGSGPNEKGQTKVAQKVIMVTLDNVKQNKTRDELRMKTREIARILQNYFGIDFTSYGSDWDLKFYQIKKEEL